jgi:hypothetical protein
MYAFARPTTVTVIGGGGSKIVLFDFRLLWSGLDVAQSIRAASKVVAVAYDKWRQLQRGTVGGNLEQSRRVGWNGG